MRAAHYRHLFRAGWGASWLWGGCYRGLEVRLGHRSLYVGWVDTVMRRLGW
jgi:hypothetical protein